MIALTSKFLQITFDHGLPQDHSVCTEILGHQVSHPMLACHRETIEQTHSTKESSTAQQSEFAKCDLFELATRDNTWKLTNTFVAS